MSRERREKRQSSTMISIVIDSATTTRPMAGRGRGNEWTATKTRDQQSDADNDWNDMKE